MKPLIPETVLSSALSLGIVVFSLLGDLAPAQSELQPKHKFVCADSSRGRLAIISEEGETAWETTIGPLHDLHILPNGNLLYQKNWTQIVEVDPATNREVWSYDSSSQGGNAGIKVEVHAFQRLDDGLTMIAESGRSRIIEVDRQGKIIHEIKLQVSASHPHRDTRLVRKLASGNYLACHEGDGVVREYDSNGKVVWEFSIPLFGKSRQKGHGLNAFGNQCFAALRKENGNTLISTGNGHGVIEVNKAKEIVWQLTQNELPGIALAWVTTLEILPNGNLVLGNCHAGPENPQLVEITKEKQVVWKFQDFQRFGNATTNTQILSTNGRQISTLR